MLAEPLSRRARIRLNPLVHEFCYALRFVGVRDRLRCPECQAVGTWKPHGTWSARRQDNDRPVRRWLCKWCGYYEGPEGVLRAFPDHARGVWSLPRPFDPVAPNPPDETPSDVLKREMGATWPWKG